MPLPQRFLTRMAPAALILAAFGNLCFSQPPAQAVPVRPPAQSGPPQPAPAQQAAPTAPSQPVPQPASGQPAASPPAASAPPPTPPAAEIPPSEQISQERIDELKARFEAATDLADEQKKKGLESLQKASDALRQAREFTAARESLLAQAAALEESRKSWEEKLATMPKAQWPREGTDLAQLEQELAQKNQALIDAQSSLQQSEQLMATRETRQRAITERLAAITNASDAVTQQLSGLASSTDHPGLVEAQRLQLLAERRRLTSEPEALRTEAAQITAEEAVNLLSLQRQFGTQRVNLLKSEVEHWTKEIANRKRNDSEGRRNIALDRAEASSSFPELQKIYRENAKIVEAELDVRVKTQKVLTELEDAKALHERLDTTRKDLASREEKIKTSTAFGIRLREERKKWAQTHELSREAELNTDEFVEANLQALAWKDQHEGLNHLDQQVEQAVRGMKAYNISDDELQEIEEKIRPAFVQQLSYLNQLEAAYSAYITALDKLSSEQDQLATDSQEFREWIEERVLWIPSEPPLKLSNALEDHAALLDLFDGSTWRQVTQILSADARRHPWLFLAGGLLWVVLLVTQGQQRKRIRNAGQQAGSRLNTSMAPTWTAIFWTVVHATVIPFPLFFLSWRCLSAGALNEHAMLARNLLLLSLWMWWLDFVRQTCRPNGLGALHFQWPARVNQIVSSQAASFLVLASPLAFVIAVLDARADSGPDATLERLCWIALFLLLAYSLHRLTSPSRGILKELSSSGERRWNSLGALWHLLSVVTTLALGALVVAGYTYAAEQLCLRLAETLVLVYAAIFLRALLFRWLMLRQRRIAIERAREIRAALAQAKPESDTTPAAVLDAQEARVNLVEVSAQSKRLLNTTIVVLSLFAAFAIWQEVLPALNYLNQWKVSNTDPPLTVTMLLTALVATILTATAARNIPGLLEITVLDQLPLDRSARYAIGTLTRYLILIVGIFTVSNTLRIGWNNVQWLVAALTFGLGFGLQEIFANFISGLIILFEQPVRVGDVVTIDDITGTVTRIRIRSTTIQNWDRKEYIIPNREFITGKVLNWTLTDTVNRIVIKIGVGYGSDPNQVRRVILETVKSQPYVLNDPAPNAVFDGFGDWALNFTVTAFLASLDQRTETVHALHTRILEQLNAAGIEIPFPHQVEIPGIPDNSSAPETHHDNGVPAAPTREALRQPEEAVD